jgi:hypothetical protein
MPGALPAGDKLDQFAVAPNEKMCRNAQATDLRKVGVGSGVESVGK